MDESLKTVRLIHQIVIGACAAIIALALSPDTIRKYKAALSELDVLNKISFNEYAESACQTENNYYANLPSVDKELLEAAHMSNVPPKVRIYYPILCEWPAQRGSVNEYVQFYERDNRIVRYQAEDPVPLEEALRKLI